MVLYPSQKIERLDARRAQIDLVKLFPPGEHGIYMYYGRIGSGKTYAMTADILEELSKGRVVYTNYPINYQGYDQKTGYFWLFLGLIGVKKRYYVFPKENLRHIDIDEDFHDNFSKITDAIVALDEGYVPFDSYQLAKMSLKNRKNVYHTRHFDRSIWLTSQRPTAVHVSMRSQVNVFYKVTRLIKLSSFILFRRKEFDLASDETVDESQAFSTKLYIGKKDVFKAYDTKYLRGNLLPSQIVSVNVDILSYGKKIEYLLDKIRCSFRALKGSKTPPTGDYSTATALKNGIGSTLRIPSDSKGRIDNTLQLPF